MIDCSVVISPNLATILAPALRKETPSNLLIYGKPGTGKSVTAKFVGKTLELKGKENGKNIIYIYINCQLVDTQYRILQRIAQHFTNKQSSSIPFTGLPTDEIYSRLLSLMDKENCITVVVLDEIDRIKDDSAPGAGDGEEPRRGLSRTAHTGEVALRVSREA